MHPCTIKDMEVNHVIVDDRIIDRLIEDIRDKPTLKNLSTEFCADKLRKYLSNRMSVLTKLSNPRSKEYRLAVRHVRQKSHEIYEVFQTKEVPKRAGLLLRIEHFIPDEHLPILRTHLSTRERIPFYPHLYDLLFTVTGYPKSILDIGCGLNPFSLPFMHLDVDGLFYTASDLGGEDLFLIRKYFERIGLLEGKTFACNLITDHEQLKKHPADICFAFKLFDVLETQKENITYKILSSLRCTYLIASFPLHSISQGTMRRTKVSYFERMVKKMGFACKNIFFENELFYIVHKPGAPLLKGKRTKDSKTLF